MYVKEICTFKLAVIKMQPTYKFISASVDKAFSSVSFKRPAL